jgi:hypothetical protein
VATSKSLHYCQHRTQPPFPGNSPQRLTRCSVRSPLPAPGSASGGTAVGFTADTANEERGHSCITERKKHSLGVCLCLHTILSLNATNILRHTSIILTSQMTICSEKSSNQPKLIQLENRKLGCKSRSSDTKSRVLQSSQSGLFRDMNGLRLYLVRKCLLDDIFFSHRTICGSWGLTWFARRSL